ncbi:MAG TPA: hypothetical protein VK481_11400, partial [Gemmatimonadaceae bacterium]|nr:hypothetical protein [Gemmatimonadaceae bacterium]
VAATLDAFTSSASGGTGPSGTVADTLDPLTSAASGSTTRPTQPWLQAVLLRPPPAGPPLPLSPPRPTLEFGAAAAILGAFTSNASGGTGPSGSVADTLDLFTASASGGFGPVGTVAVTLANAIADASGSSVIGTVVAVLQAFICIATGTATPDDPNPLTLTYRDRGHTGTIEDTGHTLTIHDRGHTATAREQR